MTRGQALQMTGWEARSHAVRVYSGRRPDSILTPSEAGSDGVIQGAGRRGDQWIQAPGLKLYTLTSPGLNHAGTGSAKHAVSSVAIACPYRILP